MGVNVENLQQFIKRQTNLSTTPAMLGRILSLVNDESTTPDDLHHLISHDQAMAQRVMRVSNSAFFGHSGQVKDIPQAIMLLGFDRVKAIAIGMTAINVFPATTSFHLQNLWIHGYETAFLAQTISKAGALSRADECFVGGLLHDIGRVVFYLFDHNRFSQLGIADDLLEREQDLFGCTHAEAGAWMGESIGLPGEIVRTIRFHHDPNAADDTTGAVSVVSLAEALCRKFNPRIEDDGIWTHQHDAILLGFNFTDQSLQDFKMQYDEARPEIERIF